VLTAWVHFRRFAVARPLECRALALFPASFFQSHFRTLCQNHYKLCRRKFCGPADWTFLAPAAVFKLQVAGTVDRKSLTATPEPVRGEDRLGPGSRPLCTALRNEAVARCHSESRNQEAEVADLQLNKKYLSGFVMAVKEILSQ
jgi:hypothetical protein